MVSYSLCYKINGARLTVGKKFILTNTRVQKRAASQVRSACVLFHKLSFLNLTLLKRHGHLNLNNLVAG
jgi:hypothetical protein